MSKTLLAVFLIVTICFSAQAQQMAATNGSTTLSSEQVNTVDQLIIILEDDDLRAELLGHLRTITGDESTALAADESVSDTSAPDAETQASDEPAEASAESAQPGLIDGLLAWVNSFFTQLPTITFGTPINEKALQAVDQVGGRVQTGLDSGQLQGFAVWALPALLISVVSALQLRRLGGNMVKAHLPVRKRRLALGLLVQLIAHIAVFVAVTLACSLMSPTGKTAQIFATLLIGVLLTTLSTNLAIFGLSSLASWRGLRLIRYCQKRCYPWLLAMFANAIFAALSNDPTLRAVVGWSAADLGGLALNLSAALIVVLFIARYKRTIGRLIFGAASRMPASDNPLRSATRWLAKHWHLLAYVFLLLSVVSIVGGQYDNDVLSQMLWSFGTVLVGLISMSVLHRSFEPRAKRRLTGSVVRRVVGKAIKRVLRIALDVLLVFAVILALLWIWGFDLWLWLATDGLPLTGPLVAVATVMAIAWLIWVAVDAWIAGVLTTAEGVNWSQRRSGRIQTLLPLVRNSVMIILVVLTGIAVLANIGVDVTPLLAGAGVFGLALSFGSQQLVQDVITGIFILAEDTITIGDTINTGDRSGVVESISLRTIRMRDKDGALHSVPFSTVKALKNSSRNFGVLRPRYTVPSSVDPAKVMDEMYEAANALRADPAYTSVITGELTDVGVDEINAGSVVVSGSLRTTALRQTELGRAFNGKLLAGLAAKGIAL